MAGVAVAHTGGDGCRNRSPGWGKWRLDPGVGHGHGEERMVLDLLAGVESVGRPDDLDTRVRREAQ